MDRQRRPVGRQPDRRVERDREREREREGEMWTKINIHELTKNAETLPVRVCVSHSEPSVLNSLKYYRVIV